MRAKKKIRDAAIPYRVPGAAELPDRLPPVLTVLYLVFNEGYASTSGPLLRTDLCQEAVRLARALAALMPDVPEVAGLLALLLTEARRSARVDADGGLVTLAEHDRSLWDRELIAEGQVHGPVEALATIEDLDLPGYHLLPATRADLPARLGRLPEARAAYDAAIDLATNDTERAFLRHRRARLEP